MRRAKLIRRVNCPAPTPDLMTLFPCYANERAILCAIQTEWQSVGGEPQRRALTGSQQRHLLRLGERLVAKGGPVLLRVVMQLQREDPTYHYSFANLVCELWETLGPAKPDVPRDRAWELEAHFARRS
jgi:hypothetical protein